MNIIRPRERMMSMNRDHEDAIAPLIGSLGSSYVDMDKLIFVPDEEYEIGMGNFKSKNSYLMPKPRGQVRDLVKMRWQRAANKIKLMQDPWYEFHIEDYPVEKTIRHHYNPVRKEWRKDECLVRMETKDFDHGAMRACFRLSWDLASNYVAKCYRSAEIPRERYFDDVRLQMDAKLWAELYNRHNPPKKIDIFQMSVLEFVDRPGSPLFHLENYMEGNYMKYNSNAGFVEEIHIRNTPNAFSHFTFESSNHELIVVDIQGVGDLYTDPQIHTAKGDDYGDGNLGVKGFALFFSSHVCNDICKSLGLTSFDMAPSEQKDQQCSMSKQKEQSGVTMPRRVNKFEPMFSPCMSARNRYLLNRISVSSENSNDIFEMDESEGYSSASSYSPGIPIAQNSSFSNHYNLSRSFNSNHSNSTSFVGSPFDYEDACKYMHSNVISKPRASGVLEEKNAMLNSDSEFRRNVLTGQFESILGRTHLEMCKYHELGRFVRNDNDLIDYEAAFFHIQQAANLGVTEALVNCAKIYMQLPHDILPEYRVDDNYSNYDIGFDYMVEAAEKGDKSSLYFVARAFDTGIGLSKHKEIDWNKAVEYYRKIVSESSEEKSMEDAGFSDINTDCELSFTVLARMGEMYMEGKNGIEKNPNEAADLFSEAADKAMAFGKGRLANKYYGLAEQAMALCD